MKDGGLFKTVIADASNTKVHQEKREVFGDASKGPTGTEKDLQISAQAKTTRDFFWVMIHKIEYSSMNLYRYHKIAIC